MAPGLCLLILLFSNFTYIDFAYAKAFRFYVTEIVCFIFYDPLTILC